MKPIAIIASTPDREKITSANCQLLKRQGITSIIIDQDIKPIGAKWQKVVDLARLTPLTHLIITGSDDILHKDFFNHINPNYAFNGLQQWYIYDPINKRLYHFRYMCPQPLGGGRVYNRTLLDAIDWQLFDTTKDKWLDDTGWKQVQGWPVNIIHRPSILAVKGPWPCMNPLSKTLKHRNAKLLKMWKGGDAVRIAKEEFDYEY